MSIPILPALNGYSVHKRPTFTTIVREPGSGRDVTRYQNPVPLWEFELTYNVLRDRTQNSTASYLSGFTDFRDLSEVFVALGGPFGRFYYLDPTDNSRTEQSIATGDGSTLSFRMVRTFGSGNLAYTEPVGGVNTGLAMTVYLNGVAQAPSAWGIDSSGRYLVFVSAPGNGVVITADFHFYYYCRFLDNLLDFSEFLGNRWELKSLKFRSLNTDGTGAGSPLSGYTVTPGPSGAGLPTAPGGYYFEVTVTTTGTTSGFGGGEYSVCLGICNGSYQLDNPWKVDINSNGPTTANGVFWQFYRGGSLNIGWSYPVRPDSAPAVINPSDVIAFAVNTVSHKVWSRNVTAGSNWYGTGSSADGPVTGNNAHIFTPGSTDHPISGNIYILAGGGRNTSGQPATTFTLNGGGPFVGTVPTGYVAWGDDTLNDSDAPAYLIFSNSFHTVTLDAVPGGAQSTAFARSNSYKLQSP